MNIFKKKKAIVCYDLSEKPEGLTIKDVMDIYKETGVILVSTKMQLNGETKMNTHIVQL